MNFKEKLSPSTQKKLSDLLFILYAGGAALLSYSLVYALRKPFTAATFDGMELFGMDYKIATSIIQIFGYMVSKFIGIKLISELKREGRLKFILVSILVAELSLVLFAPSVQCTGIVLQRSVFGMHVGSHLQFPRRKTGDRLARLPFRTEHCSEQRNGEVNRTLCSKYAERE